MGTLACRNQYNQVYDTDCRRHAPKNGYNKTSETSEYHHNINNNLRFIDTNHLSFESMYVQMNEVKRGKFAKVLRALWTYHDINKEVQKHVAVKWFNQDAVNHQIFGEFVKEISAVTQLSLHENLLQIYGFVVSPYALVTEYINGGSVETYVSYKQRSIGSNITIGDVVEMLMDAAEGISHLHTINMIHCEIAARNLLIENENMTEKEMIISNWWRLYNVSNDIINLMITFIPRRRVIVCDFGHSPITQSQYYPYQYNNNITNHHVSHWKWTSPESIKHRIYNNKTDVYSFGVLMWEVLCGIPPYPNTKPYPLAIDVITRQIRPFILDWFPQSLSMLMQRCWQEIPEFRPTFEDIKNELKLFK